MRRIFDKIFKRLLFVSMHFLRHESMYSSWADTNALSVSTSFTRERKRCQCSSTTCHQDQRKQSRTSK
eukprot:m.133005 g.133005  ORF g.133005 m.133005 type:complete len:68 (+) comp13096_c1_seq5:1297-1500(+)